jgi:hypothetical protein
MTRSGPTVENLTCWHEHKARTKMAVSFPLAMVLTTHSQLALGAIVWAEKAT